jgi:hypothetical protein
MTREVMQQAITALGVARDACEYDRLYRERTIKALSEALAQPSEPFGYFRAEPFGWTDCAPDAEGAKALYEHPGVDGPRWHDAPTCEGKWISSTGAYLTIYNPGAFATTGSKWYGPIPIYGKSKCNIT